MVERRLIYASKEVYMDRPKIVYRSEMAYIQSEGRFCMVEQTIIIGNELLVHGRNIMGR